MAETILNEMKAALRVSSDSCNDEIMDLIQACEGEMRIAGVFVVDKTDPLAKQAIKLYCKAHYGYDEKTDQYRQAYESLRDAMSLSSDYRKEDSGESKTDME